MNRVNTCLITLFSPMLLVLGACAVGGAPIEYDIPTVLTKSLLDVVQPQVEASNSKIPAKALTAIYKDVNIGNFRPTVALQRRVFQTTSDGLALLWISTAKRLEDLEETRPLQQSISLCGLVLLSDSFGVNSSPNNTVVAPVGKLFLPIPTAPVRFEERYRVDSFETDSRSICSQSASTSFSYKVTGEYQNKLIGTLVKLNKITPVTDSVTCINGPLEAGHPSFKQPYFSTTCTHHSNRESPRYEKFIYLTESRFFLPIELKPNGAVTQFFEYQ